MPFAAIWMNLEIIMGFPDGSVVKNSPTMQRIMDSVLKLGRSCGDGNGNLLQYTYLRNPMDRGAWQATIQGGHERVGHNLATKQHQQRVVSQLSEISQTKTNNHVLSFYVESKKL